MKRALIFVIILASPALAGDMKFTMMEKSMANASGDIVEATPERFAAFLQAHPGLQALRLDSVGGSITAALELGRAIRKAKLGTYVGGTYGGKDMTAENLVDYGECASACVWAFAGGAFRAFDALGAAIEVHQFYFDPGAQGSAAEKTSSAQVMMATIGMYLDEMGVDRKILDIAAMVGPEPRALPGYMVENLRLGIAFLDEDVFKKVKGGGAQAAKPAPQTQNAKNEWVQVGEPDANGYTWFVKMNLVMFDNPAPGHITAWVDEKKTDGGHIEWRMEFDGAGRRLRSVAEYSYDGAGALVKSSAEPSPWKDFGSGTVAENVYDAVAKAGRRP
jgi:hypothetical protein